MKHYLNNSAEENSKIDYLFFLKIGGVCHSKTRAVSPFMIG